RSKRMSKIRVFDPACGSGNFLVIAYKEMRAIEAEINRRRGEPDGNSDIPLTNFRGIELRDFPAEIAELNAAKVGERDVRVPIRFAAPSVDLGLYRTHFLVGDDKEVAGAAGGVEDPDLRHTLRS